MPIDVEEGYPLQAPLVYYFGHSSPSQAMELYKVKCRGKGEGSSMGLGWWLSNSVW
jgi:hypothetical protein